MIDTGCCPIVDKFSIKLSRFLQGTVFVEKLNVFRETKQMLDLLKLSFVINHSGLLTGQVLRGVWNSQSANGSPELITVDQSQAWNPSPQNPFLGSGKENNILLKREREVVIPKIFDFGKATSSDHPLIYNLNENQRKIYNEI